MRPWGLHASSALPVNIKQAFGNCVWFGNLAKRGRNLMRLGSMRSTGECQKMGVSQHRE